MSPVVIYTNWLVPPGFSAITLGWFIFIRPSRKGDEGLVEHEKVHVAQFMLEPLMFWPKYLLSKKARYQYELAAYRVQAKHNPERVRDYATTLATKYRLDIPVATVLADLTA